ncbi:hypothetical protein [Kitasatospora sp. NPDC090091]|uniref:hypothetical protein n=1 Tax=Kitasatospora sp. NPDC090091 TaxID=3364081 RepID=UPI0037F2907A
MAKHRSRRPVDRTPAPDPTLLWRDALRRAGALAAAAGPTVVALARWWADRH